MNPSRFISCAVLAAAPLLSHADLVPKGAFIEGAVARYGAYSVTAGALWPWGWERNTWAGEVSGITEAWVSHWSARQLGGGREGFNQIGIQPLLRLRFDGGASPWFMEGGIGLSYTDKLYSNEAKAFSTRFNFIDSIGAGRSFGADRKREVSMRITHFSNASIKQPNPGENFLQLRYAVRF